MSIPVPFDLPARHLQRFWGASGDFWQSQWDKFLDITGKLIIFASKFSDTDERERQRER